MNWEKAIVTNGASLRDIIQAIDNGGIRTCFVCDTDKKLFGVVTDGDVRRALLDGANLDEISESYINDSPHVIYTHDRRSRAFSLMQEFDVAQIPILDDRGCLVDVVLLSSTISPEEKNVSVVIMAGGLGKRLAPLTQNTPKPMITVGNKPILEVIIERLAKQGLKKIYLSVNYKAEMIIDYFGNGQAWGVEIEYITEDAPTGTGGALKMLPFDPTAPVMVLNADLKTEVDFLSLIKFHKDQGSIATISVREYSFEVPYGVLKIDGTSLMSLIEKPKERFFINAGIYILSPEAFDHFPDDNRFDMTDLFEIFLKKELDPCVFPIREEWHDIGRMEDLELVRSKTPPQ